MGKRGKAQISMEYVLIITLGLMIILPAVYLFRNYAYDSNENLVESRMYEIGNTVITNARRLYYYGPPSKTTLTIELPPQIDNMFILVYVNATNQEENEYYLGFRIAGKKEILIDSQVPLNVSQNIACQNLEQDCNLPNMCYCFPDKFYSKGKKIYTLEAIDNCYAGSCIIIE
jgi:hypothetical protein